MLRTLLGAFAVVLLLAGCGGGQEGTSQSQGPALAGPVSILAWTPPSTYNDNVTLDPARDLDYYEIYVRQDPNFTDTDLPVIQVAAVAATLSPDGHTVVTGPVTEFTLDLIPSLPDNKHLFVSMRAVGLDRQKSEFMQPIGWIRS